MTDDCSPLQAGDGALRLWDVEREQQIEGIAGQLKTYYSLVFSPDDSRLVGGGHDGTITVWDMTTRQQVAHWKAHDRECAWLRFVGKDQHLISLGNSTTRIAIKGIFSFGGPLHFQKLMHKEKIYENH